MVRFPKLLVSEANPPCRVVDTGTLRTPAPSSRSTGEVLGLLLVHRAGQSSLSSLNLQLCSGTLTPGSVKIEWCWKAASIIMARVVVLGDIVDVRSIVNKSSLCHTSLPVVLRMLREVAVTLVPVPRELIWIGCWLRMHIQMLGPHRWG